MRILIFVSVLALSLAGEWLIFSKTGLLEKILNLPSHMATELMHPVALLGPTSNFLVLLGSVLLASVTVSALIYVLIYGAYRAAVIASDPLS